ncbi:MAG: LuxR C-terminal-related transcriptional regulator, partial [Acetanaerobacterium sp.]
RRAAIPWPDTGLNDALSILYMYHRQPGKLQSEVALFLEYNPLYSYLISGRLDGADLVLQAEALYVTGDLQGSEIALHKALLAVHRDRQWHTWLCTVMLQMRIALMKGNWHAIEHLLGEARDSVSQKNEYHIVPATDILEIFLFSKLEQPQKIRFVFDNNLMDRFTLCFRAAPMLYCIQAEALLAKREAVQLLALSERYLEATRVYPNVYAEMVLHIEIAGAYEFLSQLELAREHLKAALLLARPDHILIPFVELSHYLRESLPTLAEEGFSDEVEEIQRLGKDYSQGLRRIITEHFSEAAHGLTGREMEIAKLAAMRLSNKEIAEQLTISESTVKTQLARAFSKLDIKKRRDLNRFFPEK